MKLKKSAILLSLFLIILIILLIIAPQVSINACLNGITVWATNILPALFPFLFFTKLLSQLNFINYLSTYISPITQKIYNTSGISGYVYLMSIVSGYPVGAKIVCDLVENNIIDSGQAHRITTFTSTSGPLFILGTVAIGMFNNKLIGYTVLFSHFLGALINGLLYRKYKYTVPKPTITTLSEKQNNILEESMWSSIKSIMIVGGYISVFFMIITLVNHFKILYPLTLIISKALQIDSNIIVAIFNGIIELTRGCLDLSLCHLSNSLNAIILSGLISFGGISINLQAYTFLKKAGINIKFFLLQKCTHCIISMILAFLLTLVIF